MKRNFILLSVLSFLILASIRAQAPAAAQDVSRRVAILGANNLSGDPRADYLGGILQGLISYDLSRAPGIVLVDRASLDKVLMETELQLSGIAADKGATAKIGSILGAHYLLLLEYAMLSGEVLITAKSVEVSSGRASSFIERGATENALHRLAESIAEYYTGQKPVFADPSAERSILTLRDESPGSVALHSIMRHAEIYLDGEFAGYTTGNSEVPFMMEKLKPGKHTLRVRGDHGFGIVVLPAVEFKEWEIEVTIQPGKKHVIRDETRDFNSVLYRLRYLVQKDFYYEKDKPLPVFETSYQDRTGKRIAVALVLNPDYGCGSLVFKPSLTVDGQRKDWSIAPQDEAENELKEEFAGVGLEIELDMRYSRLNVDVTLERLDVWQGMYDD